MRWRRLVFAVLLVGIAGAAAVAYRRHLSTEPPPKPDYNDPAAWLCRPGAADPCARPTTVTVFEPSDTRTVETFAPDPAAPIDCFYVYPTVSHVRAAYSPIAATKAETTIARTQLARFADVCRPFAPLYRQVTLAGLPGLFGGDKRFSIDVPYADVRAAWRSYLAKDNHGRGFVLIGHSQGARLLARLMAEEIDGKPIQARLVAAIIPGTRVEVPDGKPVGGTYRHIPLCTEGAQTGCVIAYSTYPADAKIPADARFGTTSTPKMRFACVDPAALDGTKTLEAALPMTPELATRYQTDFFALPGLVSGACRTQDAHSILAITAGPDDRTGVPTQELLERLAQYRPAAGYHVIDVNLALGTLVDLVRKATASYQHQ